MASSSGNPAAVVSAPGPSTNSGAGIGVGTGTAIGLVIANPPATWADFNYTSPLGFQYTETCFNIQLAVKQRGRDKYKQQEAFPRPDHVTHKQWKIEFNNADTIIYKEPFVHNSDWSQRIRRTTHRTRELAESRLLQRYPRLAQYTVSQQPLAAAPILTAQPQTQQPQSQQQQRPPPSATTMAPNNTPTNNNTQNPSSTSTTRPAATMAPPNSRKGKGQQKYCVCQSVDDGRKMVGCDGGCGDWFHIGCIGISAEDERGIDKYVCTGCTASGKATTYKRLCRLEGCSKPHMAAEPKSGKPSKYCSKEHRDLYFKNFVNNMPKKSVPGGGLTASQARAILRQVPRGEFHKLGQKPTLDPQAASSSTGDSAQISNSSVSAPEIASPPTQVLPGAGSTADTPFVFGAGNSETSSPTGPSGTKRSASKISTMGRPGLNASTRPPAIPAFGIGMPADAPLMYCPERISRGIKPIPECFGFKPLQAPAGAAEGSKVNATGPGSSVTSATYTADEAELIRLEVMASLGDNDIFNSIERELHAEYRAKIAGFKDELEHVNNDYKLLRMARQYSDKTVREYMRENDMPIFPSKPGKSGKKRGTGVCGYDPRLAEDKEWLRRFRQTPEGARAWSTGILEEDTTGEIDVGPGYYKCICVNLDCINHSGWHQMYLDDYALSQRNYREYIREAGIKLDRMRERAEIRQAIVIKREEYVKWRLEQMTVAQARQFMWSLENTQGDPDVIVRRLCREIFNTLLD